MLSALVTIYHVVLRPSVGTNSPWLLFWWSGHGAGAESLAETMLPVRKKLRKGLHLAAADGSPALQSAASLTKVPSLKGVSHIKHLFTPLSVIPKKGLVQAELNLLRNLVKQGCAREERFGVPSCWWRQRRGSFSGSDEEAASSPWSCCSTGFDR